MNHREKLLEIYKVSSSVDDIKNIKQDMVGRIKTLSENISNQKGVFTVLVTLLIHKILNPTQDIRYHQANLPNGFSGRTFDTKYITPTLKELGLPSMAESGWLTRSLEQPFPYTLDYNGKISNKKVKRSFLEIIDYFQKNSSKSRNLLRLLLFEAIQIKRQSMIKINPLKNPETITIGLIIDSLSEHFGTNYKTHGGSKLPVLAFYSVYLCLIGEIGRYKNCHLAELGSHTASDKTSKSAGDIQILKGKEVFEAIEIKLGKPIDSTIVRISIEKIHKFNPNRYYIFSDRNIQKKQETEIQKLIKNVKKKHGCQIIINGIIPTIKYYLRLVNSTEDFLTKYGKLIQEDTELKKVHKEKWNELVDKYLV